MSNFFKISIEFKAVINFLKRAIRGKHFIKFYYKSGKGNEGFRTIVPYMMIIPRKEILELVGLPIEELEKGQPRHYIISQLAERVSSKQLKILPKTFDDPGVSRDKVVTETPHIADLFTVMKTQKKLNLKG